MQRNPKCTQAMHFHFTRINLFTSHLGLKRQAVHHLQSDCLQNPSLYVKIFSILLVIAIWKSESGSSRHACVSLPSFRAMLPACRKYRQLRVWGTEWAQAWSYLAAQTYSEFPFSERLCPPLYRYIATLAVCTLRVPVLQQRSIFLN